LCVGGGGRVKRNSPKKAAHNVIPCLKSRILCFVNLILSMAQAIVRSDHDSVSSFSHRICLMSHHKILDSSGRHFISMFLQLDPEMLHPSVARHLPHSRTETTAFMEMLHPSVARHLPHNWRRFLALPCSLRFVTCGRCDGFVAHVEIVP
jgi:hypothetical protein